MAEKPYSDRLVEKARMALEKQIDESSVLYALVQLNKAVEDRGLKHDFPGISFYRSWLVHNDLDRHPALEGIFEKWDAILEGIQTGIGIMEATKRTAEVIDIENLFGELSRLGVSFSQNSSGVFIDALITGLIDAPVRRLRGNFREFRFTFDQSRKDRNSTYVGHMQLQHVTGAWVNGPEIHIRQ